MVKRSTLALVAASLFAVVSAAAQDAGALKRGIELYGDGRWRDAIIVLRQAAADSAASEAAQARYWIALSEIGAGDYESAMKDFGDVEKATAAFPQANEIPYHKGRALLHLGRYEEALFSLKAYSDKTEDPAKKSSASFWIGESLYSLGRLDEARTIFSQIVDRYPGSSKYEAAYYRLALIDQKNRELELLKLLKWSHEESLKNIEEYQRRERSYEQAIVAYQKRIAEMLKDTRLADLDSLNKELNARLAALEAALADSNARLAAPPAKDGAAKPADATPAPAAGNDAERVSRLLAIKAEALEIKDALLKRIAAESGEAAK